MWRLIQVLCGLSTSLLCSKSSPSLEHRHQGAARQPAVPESGVAECPHQPAPTGTSALAGGSPSGTHQHWLPARPDGVGYTLFLHVFKDMGGVATACRDRPSSGVLAGAWVVSESAQGRAGNGQASLSLSF